MPTSLTSPLITYFVSPHGYGHAARSAAVMAALRTQRPDIRLQIFTTVPEWFFDDSLGESFQYTHLITDIGLVQKSPTEEDVPGTLKRLDSFYPPSEHLVRHLAAMLREADCRLVVCDIAPLGIEIAGAAEIPVVLIENFTWDFIYRAYSKEAPGFSTHIDYLTGLLSRLDMRLQATPACLLDPDAIAVPPIARRPRSSRDAVRTLLRIPSGSALVLISMGGIPWNIPDLSSLLACRDATFILPAGAGPIRFDRNVILMPHRTPIPHRDLVEAADLIVTKLGYSTVAEAYFSSTRCLYLERENFPESRILAEFASQHLTGGIITQQELADGDWLKRLPDLLSLSPSERPSADGADVTAGHLLGLIDSR